MDTKNIAVVMGGCSPEHAISMESGRAVLGALDERLFNGRAVVISPDGSWAVLDENSPDLAEGSIRDRGQTPEAAVSALRKWGVDLFFLALHGPGGEDGKIQGFFDTLGFRYTASGVHASALAMDKPLTKTFLAAHGVKTPRSLVITRKAWRREREETADNILSAIDVPCFVKSVRLGSSVGVLPAADRQTLCAAIDTVLDVSPDSVMIERSIKGREISCPVLGNAQAPLRLLPLVEIKPITASFFDYGAKYEPGGAEEICDPPLDASLAGEIRTIARLVHNLIGARGFSRSDFIVDGEGIWFLEVNTIPGMTPQSIFPRSAERDRLRFTDLVTTIIRLELEEENLEREE